ncbi:isopentenyl-diphosphate Delta-isomerase [Lysobacter sp. K5869]|uniref:isopentenyl-diphosphate Delta-isomerase n=1 Tax=Lysobacter sp. K5869 TaxID=2820808 RepID=UPI001C063FD7|nr:isopentenyl-diphosphate Delta-isomerase [Lysobacter sp. K5869]QWP75398.1 isopentenyl-diphosphate Delta-isomerase [Lysobacter sp. K5869]
MAQALALQEDLLILVDADDRPIGAAGKREVHLNGWLHRAFSIFVFDAAGRVLLQRRADGKYHSAGLWSNACCGHPRAGEELLAAAHRRLREEMGFDCPLRRAFSFVYREAVSAAMIEHELDHVLLGRFDGCPAPDPDEASDWRWVDAASLFAWLAREPDSLTVWLRRILTMLGEERLRRLAHGAR